jgi:hypothetical protein
MTAGSERKGLAATRDPSEAKSAIETALAWARSRVGITDQPPGSNRGPEIDEWQLACGLIGYPWCGAFVAAALVAADVPVPREIVWTPFILDWARRGGHGFSLHRWSEREAGDLVLFRFDSREYEVDHVGLLDLDRRHTIEGNTSSDAGGSQARGGRVARRDRGGAGVVGCARPPWPPGPATGAPG